MTTSVVLLVISAVFLVTASLSALVAIARLEEEVARLRKQWQPIETAPRDERVLVDWGGRVEIAVRGEDSWQEWPDGDFSFPGDEPTRWMPLPKITRTEA